MTENAYYLGVDVGTASARAGLFGAGGQMVSTARHPIRIWRPEPDYVEQSTEDIWQACSAAVQRALQQAGVPPEWVRGIGFDATCSLALVDEGGRPVTVSPTGEDERNVIVWMDHRARDEAETISAGGHEVLRYIGGRISPEMQAPKLRWLKTNLAESWRRAAHFFDLADYLTYRATGSMGRSLCTTVCKWTYLGHRGLQSDDTADGWSGDFWRSIGLGELVDEGYRRIGEKVHSVGAPIGGGLLPQAARDFGLPPGVPVGTGIIDAYAGGLGTFGTRSDGEFIRQGTLERRLALIGGTSSCHMALSSEPRFIQGVWGPYYSPMVPGLWLTEGGQSATGSLIDLQILSHVRGAELQAQAADQGRTVYDLLNDVLEQLAEPLPFPALLTEERHVLPYFHGNRSPRADASLRGTVTGLRLTADVEDLALTYLATIQAIAYGSRHIIEVLNANGYEISTIVATGGDAKSPVFLRAHADITGCRVILPDEPEAVLLGAAMVGAVAAGDRSTIFEAVSEMSSSGSVLEPAGGRVAEYHQAKYQVFHRLYEDQLAYRTLMGKS